MTRALIVEDIVYVRKMLERCLRGEGWQVDSAVDGVDALEKVNLYDKYQLIILDLMLPRLSGEEFLKRFRELSKAPVVVVSGQIDPQEKVRLLDLGADDYLTKPFDINELKARIRAVRRRENHEAMEAPGSFSCYELEIDFRIRRVTLNGIEVRLNANEFETLKVITTHRGEVVTSDTIIKQVWGDHQAETHTLHVIVSNLRNALGPHRKWIENIHGVGYKFLD